MNPHTDMNDDIMRHAAYDGSRDATHDDWRSVTDDDGRDAYANPDRQWIIWLIFAVLTLIPAFAAVALWGYDRGLLFGWAAAIMVSAVALVVRGR